ncbi:MAG: diguanylate cyclase [Ectothiorhodospiraceae bacterium]|nr:diguanylate cyclase [Ectothiorhodospiraceae bacterium]
MRVLLCLAVMLLVQPENALANENHPGSHVDLLDVGEYLPDPDGLVTPQAAFSARGWQRLTGRLPYPGHQRFWLRAALDGHDHRPDMLLVVGDARLEAVTAYWASDGGEFRHLGIGDLTPVSARPVPHRKLIFPLRTEGRGELLLLVEIRAGSLAIPSMELWDPQAFWISDARELLQLGLFLGLLLTVAAYSLFSLALLRESSHLYYGLFLLAGALAMLAWTGLGYQFLWPESAWLQQRGVELFLLAGLVSACLFVIRLFDLSSRTPGQFVLLHALAALTLLTLLITPLLAPRELTIATLLLALLTAVSTLLVGVLHWRAGVVAARHFTIANAFALAGILAMLFPHRLLQPLPLNPDGALMLGAVGGIALWSLALIHRMTGERESRRQAEREALEAERLMRDARERALAHEREAREAQQHALRLKSEANRNLERQVKARTRELEEVLKELSSANAQLETASITDGLTGVYNRRHFDQTLVREWHRAQRQQSPLSVVMLDLDHFKPINDEYGHQVGDLCLQEIGRTLKQTVTRAGDVAARYGGEEFAVILPNTPARGALTIAEEIRRRIAGIVPADPSAASVRMTASLGVATAEPDFQGRPEDLVYAADAAVYRAKTLGRNRVVMADSVDHASAEGR